MKIILPAITVWCLCATNATAQLYVQSGASISTTNGASITLTDIDLQNNGTIVQTAGSGKFLFNGTGSNTISGTGTTQFDNIEIAKTGSGKLSLGQSLTIATNLLFTSGNIDVVDYNLQLLPAASLSGESETSRLKSSGTHGLASITTTLNAPNAINPGNLGAVITSAQNMGSTTIRRGFSSQTNGVAGSGSILRYFDILPTNNSSLNATLRINYFDAELNTLDETKLIMLKSDDNITFTPLGFTNRNAAANYVELAGISNFSRWTLSASNNVLPVTLVNFNATCESDFTLLQWQSTNEVNAASYIVEKSADAIYWTDLKAIAANDAIGSSSYSFKDATPSANSYYRLKMTDKDGSFTYSTILNSTCTVSPVLFSVYPNPAHSSATVTLSAKADGKAIINMYNNEGKLVAQQPWAVQKGINTYALPNIALLAAGNYIIKIVVNGNTVSSKLIKQ